MSCDLSDPNIQQAYEEIVSGQDTNWLILGYHDTRDKISLYSKGTGGLEELRQNLKEEVLYGFLRIENKYVLLTYVSEQVSGVRRARALVHGRAVGASFKAHQIQISASNPGDLSEANVRSRLKLSTGDDTPSSPSPTRSQPTRQNTSPSSPKQTSPTQIPPVPKSPITNDSEQESAVDIARQEAEKAARDEAERIAREKMEREAAQRREAERLAQEAAKKRAQEDAERKKQEALEQQNNERAAAQEAKARLEAEKKAREEAEKKRKQELSSQFAELEKSGKVLLDGHITVQGGGVYFWKRRYFELRGKILYLFRDPTDKLPISKIDLDNDVIGVSDAQSEVLILNSFKVDFRSSEPYYFFSDDRKTKESFVQAIARYVK